MSRFSLLLTGTFFAPAIAAAQQPTTDGLNIHSSWLITPVAGTFYERGLGSPTVVFDVQSNEWVLFFETQTAVKSGATDPCQSGKWVIGRATSQDGLNWSVDATPALEPADGTFYSCYATQPNVVADDDGTFHLFFKPGQAADPDCATNPPAWGCQAIPGVGHATSTDGGKSWSVDPTVSISVNRFGFPKATKVDGVWQLFYTMADASKVPADYSVYRSTSTDAHTWTAPAPVSAPGFTTPGSAYEDWAKDEFINPAVVCLSDDTAQLVGWFGGRTIGADHTNITSASVGKSFSMDGDAWTYDTHNPYLHADLTEDAFSDWRHWDALRITLDNGDEHFLLFFAQRIDSGDGVKRNQVGLAYTMPSFVGTSIPRRWLHSKVCVSGTNNTLPSDTDDTDLIDTDQGLDTDLPDTGDTSPDTGETGETGDSEPTHETDTPTPPEEGGCKCDTQGTPSGAGWLLLPVLGVLRRARRRV